MRKTMYCVLLLLTLFAAVVTSQSRSTQACIDANETLLADEVCLVARNEALRIFIASATISNEQLKIFCSSNCRGLMI